jgi:calcineurin-like phosphoesterase family protein
VGNIKLKREEFKNKMGIFFTADNHFSHKNILKFEARPYASIEEMNEGLIQKWNNRVKDNDSIYILGDIFFGKGADANKLIRRLNGTKYLIRGNHDSFLNDNDFDKSLFRWVKDYFTFKQNNIKYILFHYPIQVWDCQHHNAIHLYGHVHSNKDNHHPLLVTLNNAHNVGVDVNNYEPISIEEVNKIVKK